MKKKLVGILMGVAMAATTIAAPTAIFADDIDIEDIAVETEEDDVADVEVEDEAEPAEEVAAEDNFSAEADDAEDLFTDAEAADFEAQNAKAVVSADVIASAVDANNEYLYMPDHVTVSSDAAESMGYEDKVAQDTAVSVLDVLVTLHGTDVKDNLELWYQKDKGAWIDKMFGIESRFVSFAVNGIAPHTDKMYVDPVTKKETTDYVGKLVNEAQVKDDDVVDFFFYQDAEKYSDRYAYFADENGKFLKSLTVTPGETYTLNVKAYEYGKYSLSIPDVRDAAIENVPDNCIEVLDSLGWLDKNVTDGKITFTVPEDATDNILVSMGGISSVYRYIIPHLELIVE